MAYKAILVLGTIFALSLSSGKLREFIAIVEWDDNLIKNLDAEVIKDNIQIKIFGYRLNKTLQDLVAYRIFLENLITPVSENNYPEKNIMRHITDKEEELFSYKRSFFIDNNIHIKDEKEKQNLLKSLSLLDSYIIRDQATLYLSKQFLERENRKEELKDILFNIMLEEIRIIILQRVIKKTVDETISLNLTIDQAQYLRKILSIAQIWKHSSDEGPSRWKSFSWEIRQGKWLFAEELNGILSNILMRAKVSNLIRQFELALGRDSLVGLLIIISLTIAIIWLALSWSILAFSQQVDSQSWCAKLTAVLAYLLSERSREEWIGDLREIRYSWEEKGYYQLVISIYIFGLAMKLIWAHFYCKIYNIVWTQYWKRPE